MKIGNLTLPSPMVVSPMAGMTDTAFRRLVKRQGGCGLVVTEMVSSEGLVRGIDRTLEYAEYTEEERPVAIQIFGGDPDKMAEAARIVEGMGANIVDVNMGCPVAKISKHNAGCRLMREPGHAATIIAAMVRAVTIPVTVKMRKGWDDDEMNAPDVARRVEDAGAAAITIHGRTAKQSYSGTADWDFVARIAGALTIPVFGSGDCVEPEQIVERLRPALADKPAGKQGISGVFVGRGVLRNPWILAQAQDLLEGRPARVVSLEQRGRFLLDYIELLQDERLREEPGFRHIAPSGAIPAGLKPAPSIHAHGVTQQIEGVGFSPAVPRHDRWVINKVRALCSWYTKGFEHGAKLRISVNAAQSLDELRGLIADFFLLAPSRSSAPPARGPADVLDRCLTGASTTASL